MTLPPRPAELKEYRLESARARRCAPEFGLCLMGGGAKAPQALRWFAGLAGGGDLVVLGARDHDDELSNPESTTNAFWRLEGLRSLTTLVVDSRDKADDPYVEALLRGADGIFLPGGDQTAYYRLWHGTRVATAINDRARARSLPIGGSSAGMHSMGRLLHAPEGTRSVQSPEALRNPYLLPRGGDQDAGITFQDPFLDIPFMANILTDTHWSERDRMGRSIVFLARVLQDGLRSLEEARLVACDEGVAVCIGGDGVGRVLAAHPGGSSSAFFIRAACLPEVCRPGCPLTWRSPEGALRVHRVPGDLPGSGTFDLAAWEGPGAEVFRVNILGGRIERQAELS